LLLLFQLGHFRLLLLTLQFSSFARSLFSFTFGSSTRDSHGLVFKANSLQLGSHSLFILLGFLTRHVGKLGPLRQCCCLRRSLLLRQQCFLFPTLPGTRRQTQQSCQRHHF
jgi:hypothetical protein